MNEPEKPKPRERPPRDRVATRDRDEPRDRDGHRDRAIAVRSTIAIGGALIAAAALVIVLYVGATSWMSRGPGTLVIRSEPKGAAVTLDDRPTGQVTPALLKDVEAGTPHKVRVELPGRAAVNEVVTIKKRGETLEVKLDIP